MMRPCLPPTDPPSIDHRSLLPAVLALLAMVSLSGCGLFAPARHYVESGEAPALQVPSDLDRPASDPSLSVPVAQNDRLLSGSELAPPPLGARGPSTPGELYAPASGQTDLLLPNSAEESWDLVGAAIEESQIFKVVERDKSLLRYRVAIPQPATVDRRSWWRRITGQGDGPAAEVPDPEVIVALNQVAQGTEITVVDDADRRLRDGRAARVIAALDLRLKSISTRSSGG